MAVFQHFSNTTIFTWMLVEGIHLYVKLVKVFSVRKLYITYVIIGWGNHVKISYYSKHTCNLVSRLPPAQ